MFTGIVEAVGEIMATEPKDGDLRVRVKTHGLDLTDVAMGDSIATNGVCLTVVGLPGDGYWADVSVETIGLTTVKHWKVGSRVNLEKALTPQSRLGGHIVSGHVDGIGRVVSRHSDARAERFRLKAPDSLAKYIAHKGSITIDGTSLTVNAVDGAEFELAIVPHTLSETIIGQYQTGTEVNLEVDLISRYLERLLLGEAAAQPGVSSHAITEGFLAEHGFTGKR
ncbi:riboflavin synthase [Marinibactrum halimedae]|uniref:Riboflavin synthase n=1 Tax=Marinibactrum halimedae TaxID=1444977 RepID=A0AA37TCI1_9GAMM|nr:riboflavin synthase [Marinibactrum halimedae]MCD9460518.1 riboflavin synthase [Marinibactrum halimedae]GLS27881.1 riboflavin synthase subunit alpha [Marinibactrum halimedae]